MIVLPHLVILPTLFQVPRSAVCDVSRKTEGHVPVIKYGVHGYRIPKPGFEIPRLECSECRDLLVFDDDTGLYVSKCVIREIDFL